MKPIMTSIHVTLPMRIGLKYTEMFFSRSTSKINTDANNRLSAATKNSRNAQIEILSVYGLT
jgi:hypothetical protein